MNGASPALSVVIASNDRRELLRRCLDSLAAQTQAPDAFEVIVADDGSTDGTAAMVEGLDTPFDLRVLRLGKAGKASALNSALQAVGGAACLFLDDDVVASPELVAEHTAAHRDDPDVLAIGRLVQEPPAARDPYAETFTRRWNERYAELAGKDPDWADCYGGNFSAPRATLIEIGGFATDLPAVEDLEVGFRLCRAGCVVRYLPRASAVHDDQKPGRRILADERRYGAVCAQLARRHPEMRPRLLGWFTESTLREVTLRRLLLALRAPPGALADAGRLVRGVGGRRVWLGFVSRYAFWRGVRGGMDRREWLRTTRGVPVLMYHSFTEDDEGSRSVIPRRAFARQMLLLRALRYRAIGFEELARALRENRPLPRRAVAITIDDGHPDNFEVALPVLSRHRFTATIFLISGLVGDRNEWHGKGMEGRPLLSLDEVRQMRAEGIEVGAHTRTHRALPDIPDDEVRDEVAGSREDLEASLRGPVRTFAYPYGRHGQRAVAAAEQAGFVGACTTFARLARQGDDPLLIPRIEIQGTDTTRRFLRKLWFGGV